MLPKQPEVLFDKSHIDLFGRARHPLPMLQWTGPKYTVEKIVDEIFRRVGPRFCACSVLDCMNEHAQLCSRKEFGYMLRLTEFRAVVRKLPRHERTNNE